MNTGLHVVLFLLAGCSAPDESTAVDSLPARVIESSESENGGSAVAAPARLQNYYGRPDHSLARGTVLSTDRTSVRTGIIEAVAASIVMVRFDLVEWSSGGGPRVIDGMPTEVMWRSGVGVFDPAPPLVVGSTYWFVLKSARRRPLLIDAERVDSAN